MAMESLKFGKYEVVEKIGEGGFGEVFKGRDPTLKRYVAIKTCKTGSREFLDRFLLEAEISARLQHPNIVTIHDFGYQDATPYLVQEYLAGEDLDRKIRRRAELEVAAKVDILRQAAIGLRHAHHRGIVHRDVKPANLRVLEDGRVKIMDFGIAKLLSSEVELTQTGMTLGTARYQSPEQFQGDKIDLRADIFSFGVTAYELLTYERPFDGDSVARIFYRITHEDPRPIGELWPECPASLERCIEHCLRKDPAHRYSDLAPVIGVLEAYGATAGSGSFANAPPPLVADPGLPPPPPPAAESATAATVASEVSEESGSGILGRGYETAVALNRSRSARFAAFAVVALLAFALTYAVGRLWQGDGEADASSPLATAVPSAGTPSAGTPSGDDPVEDAVIIEPAAPVRKPLVATRDDSPAAGVPEAVGSVATAPPPKTGTESPTPATATRLPPPSTPPPVADLEAQSTQEPSVEPPPVADLEAQSTPQEPSVEPPPPVGPPPSVGPPRSLELPPSVAVGSGERGAVTLYQGRDFSGLGERFDASDATLEDNAIGNDSVRSVAVDRGCRVELFEDAGYGGRVTVLTAHRDNLRDTEVGNAEVSSLKVTCRTVSGVAGRRGVTLYVHGDFQGPGELFVDDDSDLADNAIGDDSASSVRVAPGCRARLFRRSGFQGKATLLTADAASLRETDVGNDEASSIEVECGPPQR